MIRTLIPTLVFVVFSPVLCHSQVVYSTDFDDLVVGETTNPASPGQDGWTAVFHPGESFGEIQNQIANGGNAIHQFTDITNTNAQQSIDNRTFDPVFNSSTVSVVFGVDFYASSSDLSTRNSYAASAGVFGDGQLFDFSVGSGNGAIRSDVGVSVGISTFNGSDNNFPLALSVGQNLAFDDWHDVQLVADLTSFEWTSISVNGQTQSLAGATLPRNFGPDGPFVSSFFDEILLQVVNVENFGDETSDSIFFDNLSLEVTAVPEPLTSPLIGLVVLTIAARRRRCES